jgi:putative ABC transport system permease protein
LLGKVIAYSILATPQYILLLSFVAVLTGLLSGIYPAVSLSRIQTLSLDAIRSPVATKGSFLRKGLVVSQFSISIVLIILTIVVYRQLDYMQNKALGFKKDNKLVIDFHYDKNITGKFQTVTQQMMEVPGVEMAGISSAIPGKENRKFATAIQNQDNAMQDLQADGYFVDFNFAKQYGLQLIAGRLFSDKFPSDTRHAMIINEAALKGLGYHNPEAIIGKTFTQSAAGGTGTVVGVIRDFHYHSAREEVRPLTLRVAPGFLTFLTLDISTHNVNATIKNLEEKWKELAPGMPMSYVFMDQIYNAQYQSEQRFGKLFLYFAGLAIFISCLGLYGLSAFSTVQRTREIGIRKVLGASVPGITKMLSGDFVKLVAFAFIIASPVALWLANEWLTDFAYRVNISWWMFLMAGCFAVIIALLTVSFISIGAAIANPVKSLRSE